MSELTNAINYINTKNSNNIYFVTDIHLFKNEIRKMKNKETKEIEDTLYKMKHFEKEANKLSSNDVLIFLGDISHVNCNLEQNEKVKQFYKNIKINKILVKGNHDQQSDAYYKECGFKFVIPYLTYKNIICTHMPVIWDNNLSNDFPINDKVIDYKGRQYHKLWVYPKVYPINIHGHIHGANEYYETYKKGHYDAWNEEHNFLKLNDIIHNKKILNEIYRNERLNEIIYL